MALHQQQQAALQNQNNNNQQQISPEQQLLLQQQIEIFRRHQQPQNVSNLTLQQRTQAQDQSEQRR
jgi:hypothetical protein